MRLIAAVYILVGLALYWIAYFTMDKEKYPAPPLLLFVIFWLPAVFIGRAAEKKKKESET